MKILQGDVFFSGALDLLLEEGNLKVHNLDRDDLEKVVQTLKWIKAFHQRVQTAWNTPSVPATEPSLAAAPKVKSKAKAK
jgi:hypothetical protein